MHMHDMDVPTSTTDVSGLDSEENYLNPLPRREVCFVVFDCLLSFLCVYGVTEKCCFVEKVWCECKGQLESSWNTYIQFDWGASSWKINKKIWVFN